MHLRERGKERASRIELDYHRQKTWLDVSRYGAALAGLLLSGWYGAWVLLADGIELNSFRNAALNTGPVSKAHASFEQDCQQCHSKGLGLPLARDSWRINPEGRLAHLEDSCQRCHQVAGHSRDMLLDSSADRDCATCHREHLGREKELAAVANAACVSCHSNLNAVCNQSGGRENLNSISDFSTQSHGQMDKLGRNTFRSLLQDQGRIRFDHGQHLLPGQVDRNRKGGFQLSMLSPSARERYRKPGQSDEGLVELDCASCHQRLAIVGHPNSAENEEGRHHAPIEFDKHCSACHQMTYAGQANDMLPLPHIAPREEFALLLSAKLNRGSPQGQIQMRGDVSQAAKKDVSALSVEQAVDAVFDRCEQCHLREDITPSAIDRALAGKSTPLIAARWLRRGYFDHAAHSRIERCEYCHVVPTGDNYQTGAPEDHRIVFIRGPESCVPCHRHQDSPAPPEFASESQRVALLGPKPQPTWASADCVLCHRYHWTRSANAVTSVEAE